MSFDLSSSASRRISHLLATEPEGSRLRVSVQGGGCSGFQYKYEFDTGPIAPDDVVIERDGAKVVIDPTSLELVQGSMLDYVEELGGAFFAIKNPNATASCGCGNSFAV